MSLPIPPVADVFAGKTILLTGGSGFTGMYTVAKILQDIPKLAKIIVPMRAGTSAGAADRWKKIMDQEPALWTGKPVEKVMVIGVEDILELENEIERQAAAIGPIHGILDTLGDSSIAGYDDWEMKKRINSDAPKALYTKCRTCSPEHPLHTVEGFVQTTTIAVAECLPPKTPGGKRPVVCAERPHPVADTPADEMFHYRRVGPYGRAKRHVETMLLEASKDPKAGRIVPCSIIRPALITGVSNMPGAAAPIGWSNQGNLNYPFSYYFFTGQPDAETPPNCRFIPPRHTMEGGGVPFDPVDICANHHIAMLAVLMTHPDRQSFIGENIVTMNSNHDQVKKTVTTWQMYNWMPHFDVRNFTQLDMRALSITMKAAAAMQDTAEGKELRKEIRRFRRGFLVTGTYVPPKKGEKLKPHPEPDPNDWQVPVTRIDWLEKQMSPSDQNVFPVQMTDRLDYEATIREGHNYFWKNVVKKDFDPSMRAQQNVAAHNKKLAERAKL